MSRCAAPLENLFFPAGRCGAALLTPNLLSVRSRCRVALGRSSRDEFFHHLLLQWSLTSGLSLFGGGPVCARKTFCRAGRSFAFRSAGLLARPSSVRLSSSYLVDPASSHMLVSKIKPCMSKYKHLYTVKLRTAHYISYYLFDGTLLHGYP